MINKEIYKHTQYYLQTHAIARKNLLTLIQIKTIS